ncbi:hypothetical protein FCG67_08755 [Rhodococcus oryzae]|uniref:Transposase n=1 Tax=Rhodococcus oryzae TaxID=2571143 RepID=A0ABY2RN14_9NOCA|nr:hypothetical protein [Rhodococcus oryzae]TJZ79683.1 hypothetical protein FCG67_08755 [Rhodococcus oryzae]
MTLDRMPLKGFGVVNFELMLLRRMHDHQQALVGAALKNLGKSATDLRAAHAQWQRGLRGGFPGGAARYRLALGKPAVVSSRTVPLVGELAVEAWPMPLWPGLQFQITFGPGGDVVDERLTRMADSAAPAIASVADLRPWLLVIDDVESACSPVRYRMSGGAVASHAAAAFTTPDGVACEAQFSWGLLQAVTNADHGNPQAD